jgi:methylmalonyl-CoA/ethylmalonyl-CoA epimerase
MSYHFDHIGIVVKNIEEAIQLYGKILGLVPSEKGIIKIPEHGIKVALLPIGDRFIELIEPMENKNGSESRFTKFLREKGEGLFHFSVLTDDYDAQVSILKGKGYNVVEEIGTGVFPGYELRLAWLQPEDTRGVWIELVDKASLPKP